MTTKKYNRLKNKLEHYEPISNELDYMPVMPTGRQIYDVYKANKKVVKIKAKLENMDGYNKGFKILPEEFIKKNNLDFMQGNIIIDICQHKHKCGLEYLNNIKNSLDILINLEQDHIDNIDVPEMFNKLIRETNKHITNEEIKKEYFYAIGADRKHTCRNSDNIAGQCWCHFPKVENKYYKKRKKGDKIWLKKQ